MNNSEDLPDGELRSESNTCSLLILDDGRVLARNVTPALASLLQAICPDDETLALRVTTAEHAQTPLKTPPLSSSTQQS